MAKSKYKSHVADKLQLIACWARDGLTDEEIANKLGISTSTFYEYIKTYAEFSETLKAGKEVADYAVESALYQRAVGYSYQEVTEVPDKEGKVHVVKIVTKEVVPDTTAQIFWLKNRQPGKWRDRREQDEPKEEKENSAIESVLAKLQERKVEGEEGGKN